MALSRELLTVGERVLNYHRLSRRAEEAPALAVEPSDRPSADRVFSAADKVALSNELLDIDVAVLPLLTTGLEALPVSQHSPPQDIKTLSTWLQTAAGERGERDYPTGRAVVRAVPSDGGAYPGEVYVAVFAVEGVRPGFYHYSVAESALRYLRDPADAMSLLRRGRPDLHFLATVPAAVLVSSAFCRSSRLHGRRGYRVALVETGQIIGSLHATAMGLGMNTVTRLRLNESSTRELIGLSPRLTTETAEAVAGMIVWADRSPKPMKLVKRAAAKLPPIARPDAKCALSYGSILAVHEEVTTVGSPVREVRPPLTDLTPVPSAVRLQPLASAGDKVPSDSLRSVLSHAPAERVRRKAMPRDVLGAIARAGFRGGTFYPLCSDGTHVALVRPFFITQDILGQDAGIWWYDPVLDRWGKLDTGDYTEVFPKLWPTSWPRETTVELATSATVICVMISNLTTLVNEAGPDLYRLAHLEAGIAAERIRLAASATGFAAVSTCEFCDLQWKKFLGLDKTGWEPMLISFIGGDAAEVPRPELSDSQDADRANAADLESQTS